jgi:hypothetical protein
MAAIEASCVLDAPPASVALLLAGPTAAELLADGTALAGAGVAVELAAPRRTGIGFAAAVNVHSSGRVVAWGSVTVQPASADSTQLGVVLRPVDGVSAAALQQWLGSSLGDLAAAARERSTAA